MKTHLGQNRDPLSLLAQVTHAGAAALTGDEVRVKLGLTFPGEFPVEGAAEREEAALHIEMSR
jgi:hypothetical protein